MVSSALPKRVVTVLLALTGMAIVVYYIRCEDACAYLSGEIFGVDLKYAGIAFMAAVATSAGAGFMRVLRMILAAGIGAEAFLVGYQWVQRTFCPYCLAFGATLVLAFAVNYSRREPVSGAWRKSLYILGEVELEVNRRRRVFPLLLLSIAGFVLFLFAFTGSTLPVYADEAHPYIYGGGPVEVRLYTDYFCGPCQSMENEIESTLDLIVAGGKARLVCIDTPVHRQTVLYARYFIYAMGGRPDYERAKKVKKALFEAASSGITAEEALSGYLRS
ncbi:MAG: hypothetical protein ACE14T_05220, partial [Syntrophales bacterium]